MDAVHQNFISSTSSTAKTFLDKFGELTQLNVLWAGTPDYDTIITQELIDSVPSFHSAGLTVAQLSDTLYVLELIRTQLSNALPALTVMARLP